MKRTILALSVLLLALVLPASAQQTPTFLEPFNGNPTGPQPWNPSTWDVQVHSRDAVTWTGLEAMTGADAIQHGTDCAPPMATHDSTVPMAYEDAVFLCRDHVMTAMKAGGYGVIYLTPPAMLDFSQGEAIISFDTSTLQTSQRDWQDIWITPWGDHHALPFAAGDVDLQGVPRRGIHVEMGTLSYGTGWKSQRIETFVQSLIPGNATQLGYSLILDPSASQRSKLEIRLRSDHIKVSMLGPCIKNGIDTGCLRSDNGQPAVWIDAPLSPPLDWMSGVVQFGHHSYNPHKQCTDSGRPATDCPADTWHWDNVSLSPYVPLTIIRGAPRMVTTSSL